MAHHALAEMPSDHGDKGTGRDKHERVCLQSNEAITVRSDLDTYIHWCWCECVHSHIQDRTPEQADWARPFQPGGKIRSQLHGLEVSSLNLKPTR